MAHGTEAASNRKSLQCYLAVRAAVCGLSEACKLINSALYPYLKPLSSIQVQVAAEGSKQREMKFRVVCRKLYDYVRYDLKEIAFPSSLPDPPHIKKQPKLTWHEHWCILKEATRLYAASWVRDIGPDLRPNDYKKAAEDEEQSSNGGPSSGTDKKGKASSEPSLLEDLAVASRGGAETLKPALRRIYMTRASTYTDAMKNFVETYQEGLKGQLQEKAVGGEGGGGGGRQLQQGDKVTGTMT